jgi:hypothetical protein
MTEPQEEPEEQDAATAPESGHPPETQPPADGFRGLDLDALPDDDTADADAESPDVHRPTPAMADLLGIPNALDYVTKSLREALLPEVTKIRQSLLPDITKFQQSVLPHLSKMIESILPPPNALRFGIEAFLRQFQSAMPKFDYSSLITPNFKAGLTRFSEWLDWYIPANLRELPLDDWERLLDISEEQRIGIVWLPRQEVLKALLDAHDELARTAVLNEHTEAILDDCIASLALTTDARVAELTDFARKAIQSHRDGHTAASQALATNVLDTALSQHLEDGVKGMQRAGKRLAKEDVRSGTLLEMRLRLGLAGIPQSYRDYAYESRDPRYSRNGTAHAANTALYNTTNSLRAITLATCWLRWLHETWLDEGRRAKPEATDIGDATPDRQPE